MTFTSLNIQPMPVEQNLGISTKDPLASLGERVATHLVKRYCMNHLEQRFEQEFMCKFTENDEKP